MNIKTKLTFGLLFLFLVIVSFGALGIFYVNRLSADASRILKDNQISVEYCTRMLKSLDDIPSDAAQLGVFEKYLSLEEHNITEPGEYLATAQVRHLFEALKRNPQGFSQIRAMHAAIFKINDVNEIAINHKNARASHYAAQATLWLTVIVTVMSLVAFSFVINFPSIIAGPIRVLTEGILEIAGKNYSKRIHLDQKDEFGTLADTFNTMAAKLDEYEHSNIAEIKAEKRRIEAIINKMNDGIIGLNENHQILFFNSAAESIFGLQERDIAGQSAQHVSAGSSLLRTVLDNESSEAFTVFLDNKESFFVQESILIQDDQNAGGRVIILRNITPFKALDAAKTNFIATVSHELKIPLFAINMSTQLLEDSRMGELNADQQEVLATIKANAARLLRITGELLNMSQIETGRIELKKEAAKPEVLVLRAMQAVQQQAAQSGVILKENLEQDLPQIMLDEEKTVWVLINFLNNAIKYSPAGSIVKISARRDKGSIRFWVDDFGKGIEAQYLDRIFDKYFQVPGTTEKTGTGLGLSISKEFIEAQGGKIWVNSVYGQGSTFGFTIDIED